MDSKCADICETDYDIYDIIGFLGNYLDDSDLRNSKNEYIRDIISKAYNELVECAEK